jgi:hypothetical protein
LLTLWQGGVERVDERRGLDWAWLSLDGALTNAPLGGEKTGRNPTDRGKRGVKRSLLTDGHGVPMGLTVDGANRHDMTLVRATIESLVVARPEPTDEQPQGMCLDTGYDEDEVRDRRQEFGFTAHIRTRGEAAKAITRDARHQARRWVVESSQR